MHGRIGPGGRGAGSDLSAAESRGEQEWAIRLSEEQADGQLLHSCPEQRFFFHVLDG